MKGVSNITRSWKNVLNRYPTPPYVFMPTRTIIGSEFFLQKSKDKHVWITYWETGFKPVTKDFYDVDERGLLVQCFPRKKVVVAWGNDVDYLVLNGVRVV